MNHLSVNKKLLSLLVSGSLVLSLGSCNSKKYNYLPMSEIFYDENVDGLDDFFEDRISDSNRQITDITTLERSLNCILNLASIDYSTSRVTYSRDYVVEHLYDIDSDKLDEIEADYSSYQSLLQGSSNMSEDEIGESIIPLRDKLYEDYVLLLNFVNHQGRTICYQFGNRLYDSIILSAGGYEGNEHNVEAKVDIYQSTEEPLGIASYHNGDVQDTTFIPLNSTLYNLIMAVGEYQDYKTLPETFDLYIRVDDLSQEQLNYIKSLYSTINYYKQAMATSYEMRPKKEFIFFDSGKMEIESGECDYSSITR